MPKRKTIFSDYSIYIYEERYLFGTRLIVNLDRGAHFESFVEFKINKAEAKRIQTSETEAWAALDEILASNRRPHRRG